MTLDIADVVQCMKFSTFAILCNGLAMAFLKVGIGSSLLRLDLSRVFNFCVIACIAISLIVNLTVIPTTFAGCKPLEKTWNKDPTLAGTCWPRKVSLVMSYLQTSECIYSRLPICAVADNVKLAILSQTLLSRLGPSYTFPKLGFPDTINGRYEAFLLSVWREAFHPLFTNCGGGLELTSA